jgi:hypothetical protein
MSGDRSTQRKALTPGFGRKTANDSNKVGAQPPTQKNQGKRTPLSREDRQAHLGADNQARERRRRQGGSGAGPMPDAV